MTRQGGVSADHRADQVVAQGVQPGAGRAGEAPERTVGHGASTAGAALFARYAYAPNALGYCGPPESDTLAAGSEEQLRSAARRFSGAWPYLQVLARLTGIADPLDVRLVESYWLGGGVCSGLDPREFGEELLALIGPQAGHYWSHLTPELLDEAGGQHCFHVFGVYPWTRLLGRGIDEHPLHVLDSCRIRWGTVLSRNGDEIEVRSRRLTYAHGALGLGDPTVQRLTLPTGYAELPDVAEGDEVALHWDRVCDRLDPEQVRVLAQSTLRQLELTNRRLARGAA